jgi:hypothetical protein
VAALVSGIVGTASAAVLAILFFVGLLLGLAAIVLGVLGGKRAGRRPGAPGRGTALAGIVLGAISVVLGAIDIVLLSQAATDIAPVRI